MKTQYGTGEVYLCLQSCLEIKWVLLEARLRPFLRLHCLVPTGNSDPFLSLYPGHSSKSSSPRLTVTVILSQTGGPVTFQMILASPVQMKPSVDGLYSVLILEKMSVDLNHLSQRSISS